MPEDVGALVEKLTATRTVVRLVNLSPTESRQLIVQAGAFSEHRFGTVEYNARTSEWPGDLGGYAGTYTSPALSTELRKADVNASHLSVELPAGMEITLDLATERYVNDPSYAMPI